MTTNKTPSDAEIAALYADETGFALGDSPAALLDFARAVLAKWGSPVVAVEPIGYTHSSWLAEAKRGRNGVFVANQMIGFDRPLYTTPQPTQAQAVPLTIAEIEQLIAQWSYELHGDRARYLVRMTEKHHRIGGQHVVKVD